MYVCCLKAPKRNALAIYKILQNIITPRHGQRDYFQLAILFKRRYMDILNYFQLFQRGYLIIVWPFVHVTRLNMQSYVTSSRSTLWFATNHDDRWFQIRSGNAHGRISMQHFRDMKLLTNVFIWISIDLNPTLYQLKIYFKFRYLHILSFDVVIVCFNAIEI